jgi:hypothetical protein
VEAASRYARAVLTIQRAYRASGAMASAVAEVMARKRATDNPYRKCGTIHALLELCYAKTASLFSAKDPRVGMSLASFLYVFYALLLLLFSSLVCDASVSSLCLRHLLIAACLHSLTRHDV